MGEIFISGASINGDVSQPKKDLNHVHCADKNGVSTNSINGRHCANWVRLLLRYITIGFTLVLSHVDKIWKKENNNKDMAMMKILVFPKGNWLSWTSSKLMILESKLRMSAFARKWWIQLSNWRSVGRPSEEDISQPYMMNAQHLASNN